MSSTISQTLIKSLKTKSTPTPSLLAAASTSSSSATSRLVAVRGYSAPPEPNAASNAALDWEDVAAQRIENAVHQIIMMKSVPDWLPFVPGGSYWVPPKRKIDGLNQLVNKIANPLNEEEQLSFANVRGWPCYGFCGSPEKKKSTSTTPLFKDIKSPLD